MTAWLSRIYWTIRGRRFVRMQYRDDRGAVEGILMGTIAGHYRLTAATFISGNRSIQSVEIPGEVWIPKGEIIMINVKQNLT